MVVHRKTQKARPKPNGFTGRLIGYARVSTADQDLSMQISKLRDAGVHEDNIWSEQVSGVKKKRPERDKALMHARKGDVFLVYKLDRLGRSFRDLLAIVDDLEQRGVGFKSLNDPIDTTNPAGKFMFHMLGAMAEFERGLIAERTRDGMAEARAQGRPVGAPLFMTLERVEEAANMYRAGKTTKQIAAHFGVSKQTLYVRFDRARIKKLQKEHRGPWPHRFKRFQR